jgi:hypothetical protein
MSQGDRADDLVVLVTLQRNHRRYRPRPSILVICQTRRLAYRIRSLLILHRSTHLRLFRHLERRLHRTRRCHVTPDGQRDLVRATTSSGSELGTSGDRHGVGVYRGVHRARDRAFEVGLDCRVYPSAGGFWVHDRVCH